MEYLNNIKEGDSVKYTDKAKNNIRFDDLIHVVKSVSEDGKIILYSGREIHPKWLEKIKTAPERVITISADLHTEDCQKNGCNCPKEGNWLWPKPYNYEFEYGYKTYVVKVNSCFVQVSLYKHQTIVELAIKEILNKKIEVRSTQSSINSYGYNGNWRDLSMPYGYNSLKKNKETGEFEETIELISTGGSGGNWKYFIIHNISDINIEEVFNQEDIIQDSDRYKNLRFLAKALNRKDLLEKLFEMSKNNI